MGGGANEHFQPGRSPAYGNGLGTGKTLTTIAIAGKLAAAGKVKRLLIVAPLSIVGVWRDEFERYAAFDYKLSVLMGSMKQKTAAIHGANGLSVQVLVTNYESAWRMEKELLGWDADLIVADEGHKIKTPNAKASKALHRLGEKARYRLLLTGTIITNKAVDVFSQYKYLNPAIFGQSFYVFRNRYFDMVGYGGYTPVLKRSMEPELTERLHRIAFRCTKEECLDLPETTDIIRYVELEAKTQAQYRSLVRDSFAELGSGVVTATNVLSRLLRLSQVTGGFLSSDEDARPQAISTAKLDMLSDIIESAMEENQKLVIIARFIPEIEAIRQLLESRKAQYALIMGNVKDRDEQVERFQNDPDCMVFVGQIATAGLGITLTSASTMVFYSLDYSMSNFEQAKARIHRAGQTKPCTYIYLTAKQTVDEKVLEALRSKADLARTLVDEHRKGQNPFDIKKK